MENARKSRRVLAGLLALALVFGSAPASLYSGGVLGGTEIVASAEEQTEAKLVKVTTDTDLKRLNETLVTPTDEQLEEVKAVLGTHSGNVIMGVDNGVYKIRYFYGDDQPKDSTDIGGEFLDYYKQHGGTYYYFSNASATTYTKDSEGIADGVFLNDPGDTIDTTGTSQILCFDKKIPFEDDKGSGSFGKNVKLTNISSLYIKENNSFNVHNEFVCVYVGSALDLIPDEYEQFIVRYDSEDEMWHINGVHKHEFTYTVNDKGDTAAAKCSDDCEFSGGEYTMSISSEDVVYDGQPHGAVLSDFDTTAFPREYNIFYHKIDVEKIHEDPTQVPVDAGTYVASVYLGDLKWISTTFTIKKAEYALTPLDTVYDGASHSLVTSDVPEGILFSLVKPDDIDNIDDELDNTDNLYYFADNKRRSLDYNDPAYNYYRYARDIIYDYRSCLEHIKELTEAGTEEAAESHIRSIQNKLDTINENLASLKRTKDKLPEDFADATGAADYIAGNIDGVTLESLQASFIDKTEWTDKLPEKKDAGEYKLWYKVEFPNYTTRPVEATAKIAQAKVTVTADPVSKTYGEEDPKLTYTVDGLIGKDGLEGDVSREKGKDAGTYKITAGDLAVGKNYKLEFVGADFTINKADIEAPALKAEDLRADGTSRELVKPVTSEYGTVKYAIGKDDKTAPAEDEFSENVPTADKEGTYYVWAMIFGDKNHNNSKAVCVKVEVAAADDETTDEEVQLGDIDKNGKVDSRDIVKVAAHIKGIKKLTDEEKFRGDTDRNEKLNSGDIVKMAAHIKGLKKLPKVKIK